VTSNDRILAQLGKFSWNINTRRMSLNQRVPGLSPGAPTSKINHLDDNVLASQGRIQFLSDPASDLSLRLRGPQNLSAPRRIRSLFRPKNEGPADRSSKYTRQTRVRHRLPGGPSIIRPSTICNVSGTAVRNRGWSRSPGRSWGHASGRCEPRRAPTIDHPATSLGPRYAIATLALNASARQIVAGR
jgi:hypothetical protein